MNERPTMVNDNREIVQLRLLLAEVWKNGYRAAIHDVEHQGEWITRNPYIHWEDTHGDEPRPNSHR